MGKRKRRPDKNKTPSDLVPHSPQMDSSLKEKSSGSVGTSTVKPLSSIMEIVNTSMKPPNAQHSSTNHHHHHHHHHHYHYRQKQQQQQQQHNHIQQNHLSSTLLLRHPRHFYGRQYLRRNHANRAADTFTYHRKGPTPLCDNKSSFKLAATTPFSVESQSHLDNREGASRRPERIRSNLLGIETGISSSTAADVVKMVCGVCQKQLRRKSYIIESTALLSSDVSVVAVLVCGHIFHADCLETMTNHQDRRDPPCPFCIGSPHLVEQQA